MATEESTGLAEEIESLIVDAQAEAEAWTEMAEIVRLLAARAGVIERTTQETLAGLEAWFAEDRQEIGADGAGWMEGARAQLQVTYAEAETLLGRVETLASVIMPRSTDAVETVENDVAVLMETAQEQLDEIHAGLELFGSDLTDDWPNRTATASTQLVESMDQVSEALTEQMVDTFTEAYTDVSERLLELADAGAETVRDCYEELETHVGNVLDDTTDNLQACGRGWNQKVNDLQDSYSALRNDLTETCEDLQMIYSIVTESMQSSGVGMHAAASILADTKSVMSGVS